MSAPLAAVFLLLTLVAFAGRQGQTAGFRIHIYPLHPVEHPESECNWRQILLRLDGDGAVRINETHVPIEELRARLANIFDNRAVKQVFVLADSNVSYQSFMEFFSQIDGASPGLEVVLISGDLRSAAEQELIFPCVFLVPPFRSGNVWKMRPRDPSGTKEVTVTNERVPPPSKFMRP
ncbi:MAG: hypothetical protein WCE75_10920 [Terracidiphilus sp.]